MRNSRKALAACIVLSACVLLMGSNIVQNVMTTLGDTIYGGANGGPTRLAGNITTAQQFLSQTGTGANSAAPSWQTLFVAPGAALMPNATAVSIMQAGIGIGDTDLYLCPVSFRCAFLTINGFNTSATTTVFYAEVKHSGVYYRLGSSAGSSVATNVGAQATVGFIVEGGDSISVNSSAAGSLTIAGNVVQFANTSTLATHFIVAPSNGDNTVYTVPVGRTAVVVNATNFTPSTGQSLAAFFTSDIANRAFHWNFVPAAGTPGATNQVSAPLTSGANMFAASNFGFTMTAGQFASINITVANAADIAWLTVMEF